MSLDHIHAIVERTNALKPDIVVLLPGLRGRASQGDTLHLGRRMGPGARRIEGAARRSRGARHHDWWDDKAVRGRQGRRRRPRAGGRRHSGLRKRSKRLSKDGKPFWAGGSRPARLYAARRSGRKGIGVDDLGATLAKVTDDAPLILMAHEPDIARRVPSRVALQLSGIPWRPVADAGLVAIRRPAATRYGHIKRNCDVFVSGGLGCSIMRSVSASHRKSCW